MPTMRGGGGRKGKGVPAGIGIMGGSFDPIHLGHLIVAERAAEALGADRVLFIPCNIPPHKDAAGLTSGRHRLRMIALAAAGNPKFRASDIELRRGGVSYTVETIEELRRIHGPGTRLWFIIGADSLRELDAWRDYRRLLRLCTVVTAGRPGAEIDGWRGARGAFSPGELARLRRHFLDAPLIGISSSEIRRRRRAGMSIRYLVPPAVERYIAAHGLYRGRAGTGRVRCRAAHRK